MHNRNKIYEIAVIILYVFLSGCATKSEYVKFFPSQENKYALEHSAKLIETFDPEALDNNYSVIGYITSEHVLRECPSAFGECETYAAKKSLVDEIEQHASKQGGSLVTHTEKRYIKWVGTKAKCTKWEQVSAGVDKNGNSIMQMRCALNVKYTVTFDTVVLHGLVWRRDSEFHTSPAQRLNQIAAWQSIISRYGKNCLIISPSAQAEYDSLELQGFFRDMFLKVHRSFMNEAGLGVLVNNTRLQELYDEVDAPVPEIPCEILQNPFIN